MRAAVATPDGVYDIDLDAELVVGHDPDGVLERSAGPALSLPRVLGSAAAGSTVVAMVNARPPLLVSHDAGRTWREAGAGLPRGVAVAIDEDNPDTIVYASRNRLHVSEDGGRFWRSLAVELPEIQALELIT